MKKTNLFVKAADWVWLILVILLRNQVVDRSGKDLILELLIFGAIWAGSAAIQYVLAGFTFPRFDRSASLLPVALAAIAIVLTCLFDCRNLLFPAGILILAVALEIPGSIDGIIKNTVVTAVLIAFCLPAFTYVFEYLLIALAFIFLICHRTYGTYATIGQQLMRLSTAALIFVAVGIMLWLRFPFADCVIEGEPLELVLKTAGFGLVLFRAAFSNTSSFRMALQLLALAMPGSMGLLFWGALSFGEDHWDESEDEMDEFARIVDALPRSRIAARQTVHQLKRNLETEDVTLDNWSFAWRKFGDLTTPEEQLTVLLLLGRSRRGAVHFATFLVDTKPEDAAIWELYEEEFERLAPTLIRWRVRRLKKRLKGE